MITILSSSFGNDRITTTSARRSVLPMEPTEVERVWAPVHTDTRRSLSARSISQAAVSGSSWIACTMSSCASPGIGGIPFVSWFP